MPLPRGRRGRERRLPGGAARPAPGRRGHAAHPSPGTSRGVFAHAHHGCTGEDGPGPQGRYRRRHRQGRRRRGGRAVRALEAPRPDLQATGAASESLQGARRRPGHGLEPGLAAGQGHDRTRGHHQLRPRSLQHHELPGGLQGREQGVHPAALRRAVRRPAASLLRGAHGQQGRGLDGEAGAHQEGRHRWRRAHGRRHRHLLRPEGYRGRPQGCQAGVVGQRHEEHHRHLDGPGQARAPGGGEGQGLRGAHQADAQLR
mmetsp:Transcript_45219/g.129714  ORF Transcript_45219/g.129714 Transcript_45219/m.129714 type:complete len:258 (-) Transcript_45219:1232-2005(-)